MDVAGAIIGIVGLSGQILQGCNYLCDFFGDMKGASRVISRILTNIQHLCTILEELEAIAGKIQARQDPLSIPIDATPVLDSCSKVIEDLRNFANENGGPDKSWRRFNVARKQKQLERYATRLEESKSSVQLVQTNLMLASQLTIRDEMIVMSQTTMQRLDEMPFMLRSVVEATLEDVLSREQLQLDKASPFADSALTACTSSKRQYVQPKVVPVSIVNEQTIQPSSISTTANLGLGPKRQKKITTTYNFWFGCVVVTAYTTCREFNPDGASRSSLLSASSRTVDVHFNTWFAKKVAIKSLGRDYQP